MNVRALTRSATLTIALLAVATIASELTAPFKALLSAVGGHHWIGKSVLSIVFFSLLYGVFSRFPDEDLRLRDTWVLVATVVLGGLAIAIFYAMHFQ